jgi:hypothetical protein
VASAQDRPAGPVAAVGRRGRSPQYADLAIETGHLLRLAFGRPWRQTEGLLRSLTALLGVSVGVPDHTTFMWTAWARQWGSISRGFFVPGRASVAASWGGSGQVRPYVRPVARRMPLATMGVRLRARHQSLSRALEAQRRVRYRLDCFGRQPLPSRGATLPAGSAGLAPGVHRSARGRHAAACAVAG